MSSLPAFSNKHKLPLSTLIAVGNLLSPFVSRSKESSAAGEEGGAPILEIGFPTTEALAQNISELLRLGGAAVVSYNEYLSRPTRPGVIPMDEASLLFSTIAIRSMSGEANVQGFNTQMKEARASIKINDPLEAKGDLSPVDEVDLSQAMSAASLNSEASSFDSFGVDEIRYLMHWIRAELSLYFADVNYILGSPQGHQGHMQVAQTDRLVLLKLAPSNLSAYVLYSRSCLQFQQFKAAFVFSSKGITVAEKLRDDSHLAQLLLINATSVVLGGGPGPEGQFNYTAVVKSYQAAMDARDKCVAWLPGDSYKELLELEPELSIITVKVITALSEQAAAIDNGNREVLMPCLKSHYATKEPSSVPPGAVEEDGEGGVRLRPTGFDVEENEEGEGGRGGLQSPVAEAGNGKSAKKPLGKGKQRTQRRK